MEDQVNLGRDIMEPVKLLNFPPFLHVFLVNDSLLAYLSRQQTQRLSSQLQLALLKRWYREIPCLLCGMNVHHLSHFSC